MLVMVEFANGWGVSTFCRSRMSVAYVGSLRYRFLRFYGFLFSVPFSGSGLRVGLSGGGTLLTWGRRMEAVPTYSAVVLFGCLWMVSWLFFFHSRRGSFCFREVRGLVILLCFRTRRGSSLDQASPGFSTRSSTGSSKSLWSSASCKSR